MLIDLPTSPELTWSGWVRVADPTAPLAMSSASGNDELAFWSNVSFTEHVTNVETSAIGVDFGLLLGLITSGEFGFE